MVVVGVLLLLPGICAVVFMGASGGGGNSPLVLLWLICFGISAAGVYLIIQAFR
jgi:hypothetical protein